MMPIKTKERFNNLLEGFVLLSADIKNKNRMVFILKSIGGPNGHSKDGLTLPTRLLYLDITKNKDKHGIGAREWKQGVKRGWVALSNDSSSTIISCNNTAMTYEILPEMTNATKWEQIPSPINAKKSMTRGIWGCKTIDADTYMYGKFRKLYKRIGPHDWKDLSYEDQHPLLHADLFQLKKQKASLNGGFDDIDGFNRKDIYACGSGGDCWHYDGERWQRLDLPVNSDLKSILCAKDGFVYIGLLHGDIIKGRYHKDKTENWEILRGDGGTTNSLAWFKGRVFMGSDLGLFTINYESKITQYHFPEEGWHQYSFKHVVSCDDALLSYGTDQALIYDGKEWEEIVGTIVVPD